MNLFGYAQDNPVLNTDPEGRWIFEDYATGANETAWIGRPHFLANWSFLQVAHDQLLSAVQGRTCTSELGLS